MLTGRLRLSDRPRAAAQTAATKRARRRRPHRRQALLTDRPDRPLNRPRDPRRNLTRPSGSEPWCRQAPRPTASRPLAPVRSSWETSKARSSSRPIPMMRRRRCELAGADQAGLLNGQRFHRVVPGFVIQVGYPQTRDMSKRDQRGRGAGGRKRQTRSESPSSEEAPPHEGAVAMAHAAARPRPTRSSTSRLAPKPRSTASTRSSAT